MQSRLLALAAMGAVALATVLAGVVILAERDSGRLTAEGVALVATALGASVGVVTAGVSARRAQLEARVAARRMEDLDESEYLAYARAQDFLSVLHTEVRRHAEDPDRDPPESVLSALMAIRASTGRLARMGRADLAVQIDDEVRRLLEADGKASWLWTFPHRSERPGDRSDEWSGEPESRA